MTPDLLNPNCILCDNQHRKRNLSNGLCRIVKSVDDDLPVRCVGPWAKEKIDYLRKYLNAFSTSMKSNVWDALNYIEICSGPGLCINRKTRREFNGTALAILDSVIPDHVTNVVFCDIDELVLQTLENRVFEHLKKYYPDRYDTLFNKFHFLLGSYEDNSISDAVCQVVCNSGRNPLSLTFIDPTDLSVPFHFIETLLTTYRSDLLLNFAFGTDFKRNIVKAIKETSHSGVKDKYSTFIGNRDFIDRKDVLDAAERNDLDELLQLFNNEYAKMLRSINLPFIDFEQIKHFYYLLFASQNEFGLKLWKRSHSIGANDERTISFD